MSQSVARSGVRFASLAFPLLWVLIGFGIFMRIWNLDGEGLRLDESQSVWQAMHSLEFIRTYMLKNVHLPLHNSLLHGWMLLFGQSEFSVRTLALIPGVLAVPAFFLLAREFLRPRWVLFATALAALSPFWVWYSREIRMYSLLALITTLSYYVYVKILKENRAHWYLLYALVSIVGMYTHYFFFLVLFVQFLFFFLTWRVHFVVGQHGEKLVILRRFIAVTLALIACFAPWLYLLVTNYGSGSLAPTLEKPHAFNIILQFYEFIFGYHPDTLTAVLIGGWPLLILVGFLFLSKRNPFSALTLLLLLGVLVPIVIGFAASQYMPIFLSRYFIIVTPPLFILLAWFISELPGKSRFVIGGILMTVLPALLINQTIDVRVPTRENYRDATQYIVSQVGPRDIVVVSPPYLLYPTQYYYHGDAMLTTYPLWDKRKGGIPAITESLLEQDLRAIKSGHSRIFLLASMDLYGAVEGKTYLDNHLTRLDKRQFSKNVWVYVYLAEYFSKDQEENVPVVKNETGLTATHKVVPGETLAGIAMRYYGDPLAYPRLQEANGLRSAGVIHPGDELVIPDPLPGR